MSVNGTLNVNNMIVDKVLSVGDSKCTIDVSGNINAYNLVLGSNIHNGASLTLLDSSGNGATMSMSKWNYLINTVLAGR